LTEHFQAAQSPEVGQVSQSTQEVSSHEMFQGAQMESSKPTRFMGELTLIPCHTPSYFDAVPNLNELREQVCATVGPSAYDLVNMLNKQALQAGFEPVGANVRGITADEFFKSNQAFQELESQLAAKIVPENVSEVLALIKDTCHYKPTRRIVSLIEGIYRRLLEQQIRQPPG
jgi:hypothetical protein